MIHFISHIWRCMFCIVMVAALVMVSGASVEATGSSPWYWISSDSKYSKYYDPAKVQVVRAFGRTAVQINAETRTVYSISGARETLENYGLKDIAPDRLSYSLAQVQVSPQLRTIAYMGEQFYDKSGKLLWSKQSTSLRHKEINSQEFDEDFYCAIVDSVFHQGENERRKASDRWLVLWQNSLQNGGYVHSMADTTTMRLQGENIIFWEWQERTSADGKIAYIQFMKKAVDIPQFKEKIIKVLQWSPSTGWQDTTSMNDIGYKPIQKETNEYSTLKNLRIYADEHENWVKRYSLQ